MLHQGCTAIRVRTSRDKSSCVQPQGLKEMDETVAFYKENAAILRDTFKAMGFSVYGGEDAPYVWVRPVACLQGF